MVMVVVVVVVVIVASTGVCERKRQLEGNRHSERT
jgi:hypothetical protein